MMKIFPAHLLGVLLFTLFQAACPCRPPMEPERPTTDPRGAREAVDRAFQKIQQGDALAAIPELHRATSLDPDWAQPWLLLAEAHLASDNDTEAIERALTRARELDPSNARVRYLLGTQLFDAGQFEQARTELSAAVETAPDEAQAQLALGRVLDALDQPAAATPHYERVLQLDPANEPARLRLYEIALAAGEVERAERHLRNLVERHPDRYYLLMKLMQFYLDTGQSERAAEVEKQMRALQSDSSRRRMRPLPPSKH